MESYPTISFFCVCRKRLYTMSTNIVAYHGTFKCRSCGRRYICSGSIIATIESSSDSSSMSDSTVKRLKSRNDAASLRNVCN